LRVKIEGDALFPSGDIFFDNLMGDGACAGLLPGSDRRRGTYSLSLIEDVDENRRKPVFEP
jgi:hypothetical protein